MSPKLHLYMTSGACSLAPHIALQEAGLEFTTTDLHAQRSFPSDHLHINPKGRVPILDFDGEIITETPAILSLISDLAPEKKLLGTTLLEQARAREWMAYLSGTVHGQAFGCLFRPKRFVGDEEAMYDTVKATGRQCAQDCFAFIEEKLQGRTWGNMLKMGMRENYPAYAKLVGEVVKREAARKVIEAEGIDALNE
ncbi:hypothetical protein DE146DRAFT_674901 [Phaeosphaeria sp. MPI-PUGE-AT-0046c]|nr:hypothetical protein DE146DRAFT_674901 [Phaeosphaeria sp. MPI-PUGE-AT-0046c]